MRWAVVDVCNGKLGGVIGHTAVDLRFPEPLSRRLIDFGPLNLALFVSRQQRYRHQVALSANNLIGRIAPTPVHPGARMDSARRGAPPLPTHFRRGSLVQRKMRR